MSKRTRRYLLVGIIGLLALALTCSCSPPAQVASDEDPEVGTKGVAVASAEGHTQEITVFFTSDTHGAFTGYNYATTGSHAGMARVLTLLNTEREALDKAGKGYLTVDVGDAIQGAGTSCFIGNNDYTFPMIKAFDYLEYDAVVLGNHEFNFGIENMYAAYNGVSGTNNTGYTYGQKLTGNVFQGNKPVSDVDISGDDPLLDGFKAYHVYDVNGINIAVIGMTHPGADVWDAQKLTDAKVYTEGITTATKRAIQDIRTGDEADIIVLAIHTSQGNAFDRAGSGAIDILNDSYVAENVDVVLGAHGHTRTDDGLINGVRYAENAANGGSVGIVTLTATYTNGSWGILDKAEDVRVEIRQTMPKDGDALVEDQDYLDYMAAEDAFARAYAAEEIGELINGNMVPDGEISGVTQANLQPTKLISFINEVQSYFADAQISAATPFAATVQHLEGPITRGSLIGIYKFDSNTIYKLEMKGWQVQRWMEWSAGQYGQFDPATDLTISHSASYFSDHFSGLEYTVDLTQPEGSRITITAFTGDGKQEVFDPEKTYTVAANDHRTQSYILSPDKVFTAEELARDDAPKIVEADCARGLRISPDIISLMAHYIQEAKGGVIDASDYEENWKFVNLDWNPELRKRAVELINDGLIDYSTEDTMTIADIE